jgi:4-hydroxy-tetrahydrodipicolinate synthase
MPTRAERFAGLSVALVTPFRDGILDTARLTEQIDFQAAAGTTCICPVGTSRTTSTSGLSPKAFRRRPAECS